MAEAPLLQILVYNLYGHANVPPPSPPPSHVEATVTATSPSSVQVIATYAQLPSASVAPATPQTVALVPSASPSPTAAIPAADTSSSPVPHNTLAVGSSPTPGTVALVPAQAWQLPIYFSDFSPSTFVVAADPSITPQQIFIDPNVSGVAMGRTNF
ncbi:hypothetical protein BT69DRAFT_1321545 [Atractiella rhizophila]|nr:hypothetical protein BT69DRAFT_1321545 [Atractiella rhizophila]